MLRLEELLAFLFPFNMRYENRWPLVIYAAYYDESDQKPGFAMGGFSASYLTWVHLDWAWRDLLARWNIRFFKASECENLLGEFAQYRDCPTDLKSRLKPHEFEKVKEIKTQFIDVICRHRDDLQGYGVAVVIEDFERIISESANARKILMDNPYYIAAQLCLVAAAMPARAANKDRAKEDQVRVKPIFDSHREYGSIANMVFDKFPAKNPRAAEVLLPPDYEDDQEVSALQVSDCLVYEIRKLLTGKLKNPEAYEMRTAMKRLLPSIFRIYKLSYKSLKVIVDNQVSDSIPIKHLKPEELF